MAITVFYAWQLDRNKKVCRHLIKRTLIEGMSSDQIVTAMSAGFTRLWMDIGLPSDPCFDADGKYIP